MAGDRAHDEFGRRLRAAREQRGISLRYIANKTKISMGVLEALERGDISRLPGGIFSRAFVRTYAVEVGLDPEDTIQEFLSRFPHDAVAAGHSRVDPVDDGEALESSRRLATTFLWLAAISIPMAGVMLYFSAAGPRSAADAPIRDAPASEAIQPDARRIPAVEVAAAVPSASAPDPAAAAEVAVGPGRTVAGVADRLTVDLTATRPCWVSATVDGQKAIDELLQAGDERTLAVTAELVLKAGDAAALTLRINGAPAKPLGKPGEVATARVTLSNFKDYLVPQ